MNPKFSNTGILNYNLFTMLGRFLALVYILFQYKKQQKVLSAKVYKKTFDLANGNQEKVEKYRNTFALLEILILTLLSYTPGMFLTFPFGELIGTGANYFAALFSIPIIWIAFSILIGNNFLKQIDILTTSLPLVLFFDKIGCYCAGCCNGIYWPGGPRNEKYGFQEQFPVQLVEAGWAAAIFIFLLIYERKNKKSGTVFPLYMILYTFTRFFSEFYRAEENVLGPLKIYHLLCIFGFVLGVLLLLVVLKFGDRITAYYDKKHSAIDSKYLDCESEYSIDIEQAREKERKAEEKRKRKEWEKKNKKKYSKSRKL